MSIQSEAALEAGLIATLQQMDYEYVQIAEEENLQANFKRQLEVHNRKRLAEHGRTEFTDEEFEKIKTEKERSIQILHFAQLNQISPVYYNKAYQVIPEIGGEKAFELLRKALMDEQKIAIGKTVFGTKETLMSIIPRDDCILIVTMFYEEDIKEIPKSYKKPEIEEAELTMAKTLINYDENFYRLRETSHF